MLNLCSPLYSENYIGMTVFRLHSAHFGSDHHGQRIGNITNVIDVQTPIANTYRNYVLSSHL